MSAQRNSRKHRLHRLALFAGVGSVLSAPGIAHASTPDDVRWGEGLDLQTLEITVDGQSHTTRGVPLIKAPHSLTLYLPLSIFGLPGGNWITATGSSYADKILWTFDESALGIDLGDAGTLNRVNGWIEVEVDPLSAADVASCSQDGICLRNAKLELNAADVFMHGTNFFGGGWSESIPVTVFEAEGGLRSPAVQALWGPTQVNAETDKFGNLVHFQSSLTMKLDGISPTPGTTIALDASVAPGSGFSYPAEVFVPAGQTSASVLFNIYPNYTGRAQLVATSSSNQYVGSFTVLPPIHEPSDDPWVVNDDKPVWEQLLECVYCSTFLDWSNPLGPLLAVEDQHVWIQFGQAFTLEQQDMFAGAEFADFGANGWVTGTMSDGAAFVAQFVRGDVTAFSLLPGSGKGSMFLPRVVDSVGNVAGDLLGDGEFPVSALWPRGTNEAFELDVGAESSEVRAFHEGGYVAGTTLEGHGFIAELASEVMLIERPEGADALVFEAVNGGGEAAGYVLEGYNLRAAYYGPETELLTIPELPGYANHWAVGITEHGEVLVNASEGEQLGAFVWSIAEQEWRDADSYLPPESGLHIQRFAHVASDGFVVFDAVDPDEGESTFTTQMYR